MRKIQLRGFFIPVAVMVTILLVGNVFISSGLRNFANKILVDTIVVNATEAEGEWLPYWSKQQTDDPILLRAKSIMNLAERLNPNTCANMAALIRINLTAGDTNAASNVLSDIDSICLQNPFTFLNTLTAHSWNSNHDTVVALANADNVTLGQFTRLADEMIALAHISQADLQIRAGQKDQAPQHLRAVLEKRESDLYALYHLLLSESSIERAEDQTRNDKLEHFSLDSLFFLDNRLADFSAEAIGELLADGTWSFDLAYNAIANLVWIKSESPATQRLLSQLVQKSPYQMQWKYLLAELYQRQNMWLEAQLLYLEILDKEPHQNHVLFRLAEICERLAEEQDGCSLQEAVELYRSYQRANPQDILPFRRLGEIDNENTVYLTELETNIPEFDVRALVAEQLGLDLSTISLGPNLIPNSSFEDVENGQPTNWHFVTMANSDTHNRALFNIGLDTIDAFDGQYSVRVGGVWAENSLELGSPNSGVWFWNESGNVNQLLPLLPGSLYLLSFYYRTNGVEDGSTSVWLNSSDFQGGSFRGEHQLPDTQNTWRQAVLVGSTGQEGEFTASPLFRLSGTGRVWFDHVEMRKINLANTSELQTDARPLLLISN